MATKTPRNRYDLCGAAHDYPDWVGAPARSLLICTHPRSGSTMLGEALYFAGNLGCPLEYVHAGFRPGFEEEWGVDDARGLTREIWRRRTDPTGTMSIKLFWRDVCDLVRELAPDDFPDLLTTPAADVSRDSYRALAVLLGDLFPNPVHVHLERRDRLRQAVSSHTASHTGVWRRIAAVDANAPPRGEVMYDFDRIGSLMASGLFCHAHWQAYFRANDFDVHAMVYEELIADYSRVVESLLRKLDHPGEVPPIRMERQSTAMNEALIRRFLQDQRTAMQA